jgi:hypothetical protein
MTCEELRPQAAGVAALPEGDPGRDEYLAHARGCAGCMEELRKGEQLIRLLAAARLPAPSAEALRRASDPILATLSRDWTKKKLFFFSPRAWALRAGAAVAAFAMLVLVARHLDPEAWVPALVVAALAAALAGTAGVLRAGALVAVAAAAAFALAAGGAPGFAFAGQMGGLVPGLGIECMIAELVSAALPLAAAAWVFRRDPRPGALAQAAAAGALAGQAALHLGCSAHAQAAHLWVFHVGGVALAALAGWIAEGRLLSVRE